MGRIGQFGIRKRRVLYGNTRWCQDYLDSLLGLGSKVVSTEIPVKYPAAVVRAASIASIAGMVTRALSSCLYNITIRRKPQVSL